MNPTDFEDIRPYNQAEVAAAMQRIAADPHLEQVSRYLFPDQDPAILSGLMASISDTWTFQHKVMLPAMQSIARQTMDSLTYDGFQDLNPTRPYLFISNHRDIVLDAAIFQILLDGAGFPTSQISFGDNLMSGPFVNDIGKSNKMFKVKRMKDLKDFLRSSKVLSQYLRRTLTVDQESLWIAQRNGRTKDGLDHTDQGIVKMFAMSADADTPEAFLQSFAQLHIAPFAISYEYEPCDREKTWERYVSQSQKYVKAPGEDLRSIITGIQQYKGRVHYQMGPELTREELAAALEGQGKNERFRALAELIDSHINALYTLWPTHYMASDLLHGTQQHRAHYRPEDLAAFETYVQKRLEGLDGPADQLRRLFLTLYANPVDRKQGGE